MQIRVLISNFSRSMKQRRTLHSRENLFSVAVSCGHNGVDEDLAVFNGVKKVYTGVGDFHPQQLLKFITHSPRPSVNTGMEDAEKLVLFKNDK